MLPDDLLLPALLGAGVVLWCAIWLFFSHGRVRRDAWVARLLRTSQGRVLALLLLAASLDLVFGAASSRDLTALTDSPLTGQNLVRACLLSIVGLWSAFALLSFGQRLGPALRLPTGAYVAYGAVGLISVLYSSAPLVSLGKALEVVIAGMAIVAIAKTVVGLPVPAQFKMVALLWDCVVGALLLRLAVYWLSASLQPARAFITSDGALPFVPGLGFYGAIHPNSLGMFGAIVALVALIRVLRRSTSLADRVFWSAVGALGATSLFVSQARTSVFAFVVLLPLATYLAGRLRLALVGGIGVVFVSVAYMPAIVEYVVRGQGDALLLSLSGRVFYWSEAVRMFSERPLLGHGFYTGVRVDLNERYAALDLSTVDQTYLEVALNSGLIGLLPFLLALFGLGIMLTRAARGSTRHRVPTEMLIAYGVIFFRAMLGPSVQVFNMSLVVLVPMFVWVAVVQNSARTKLSNRSALASGQPALDPDRRLVLQGVRVPGE